VAKAKAGTKKDKSAKAPATSKASANRPRGVK
jgi:hypothetical protein